MPLQSARTVTAANQWTTPISLIGHFTVTVRRADGAVGSLGGTTVTVQRSVDGGGVNATNTASRSRSSGGSISAGSFICNNYVTIYGGGNNVIQSGSPNTVAVNFGPGDSYGYILAGAYNPGLGGVGDVGGTTTTGGRGRHGWRGVGGGGGVSGLNIESDVETSKKMFLKNF